MGRVSTNRIGERALMKCGEYATITAYRNANDIDVCFDDGTVRIGCQYYNFTVGHIAKINGKRSSIDRVKALSEKRTGDRRLMKCGEYATIVAYRGATDIDVRFDDGTTRTNCRYESFCRGGISKIQGNSWYLEKVTLKHAKERIGSRRRMNCGDYATVVAYRHMNDIDIQFDDGDIRTGMSYDMFKRGKIAHTKVPVVKQEKPVIDYAAERVGLVNTMNCGLRAQVIQYNSAKSVIVIFEDGSKCETTWSEFKLGQVGHALSKKASSQRRIEKMREKRLGEEVLQKCGQKAKIIEYRGGTDIDILFEDGSIRTGVRYGDFHLGRIGNINVSKVGKVASERGQSERVNQVVVQKSGMKAWVIEYNSSKDCTIQFEDGNIRRHVVYQTFLAGQLSSIKHEGYDKESIEAKCKERVGLVKMQSCGLRAKILRYGSTKDVDVVFEDGSRKNTYWGSFERGTIGHPVYGGCCSVKFAYTYRGSKYYIYEKSGTRLLGTLKELLAEVKILG